MLSEILRHKKLFSLLHAIDVDLAQLSRAARCPFVVGRCITLRMYASLVAARLIYQKTIVSD
jgi:hypothetical protein